MTSKGATIDVGAWLQGLGFGQYEAMLTLIFSLN